MKIEIYPKKILVTLCVVIFALMLLNLLGIVSKFGFDHDYVYGLVPLFDFDTEKNIPTFFSACMLMLSSAILATITHIYRRGGEAFIAWGGLSIIFVFLSIDEIASIHERFIEPVRTLLNVSGLLFYAWVIPYGLALAVFMVLYLEFLLNLPEKIMRLFLLSGGIYVSGALGVELLGGRHVSLYGADNYGYALFCTVEETLEMVGISLFIYTLLRHMVERFSFFTISVVGVKHPG
ncbi:hypothetical protein A9Q99_16270 [Gammaproteobacteria bacterium 45_16_T64]|nr:hypothetical protein A9Q99_16270 [Gammaproteobacteria bacterium 45_16_T64]